jgi:hypothetical protein
MVELGRSPFSAELGRSNQSKLPGMTLTPKSLVRPWNRRFQLKFSACVKVVTVRNLNIVTSPDILGTFLKFHPMLLTEISDLTSLNRSIAASFPKVAAHPIRPRCRTSPDTALWSKAARFGRRDCLNSI